MKVCIIKHKLTFKVHIPVNKNDVNGYVCINHIKKYKGNLKKYTCLPKFKITSKSLEPCSRSAKY